MDSLLPTVEKPEQSSSSQNSDHNSESSRSSKYSGSTNQPQVAGYTSGTQASYRNSTGNNFPQLKDLSVSDGVPLNRGGSNVYPTVSAPLMKDSAQIYVSPTESSFGVEQPAYGVPLSPTAFGSSHRFVNRSRSASSSSTYAQPFVAPISSSVAANGGASGLQAQPSFRRHHRQRSSTIYVAARPAPPSNTGGTAAPEGLLRGMTTLAGAQLLAKLLTFVLNQVLLRFLNARELGSASQLELLISSALILSRNAIRLTSQRITVAPAERDSGYTTDSRPVLNTLLGTYQETSNLGWVSVIIGAIIVSITSSALYAKGSWNTSVIILASAAAMIELLAEPGFLVFQLKIQLSERARSESLANVVRVIVVAASLLVFHLNPFLGFSLGHLGYSVTLAISILAVTCRNAREDGFSMLPSKIWSTSEQKKLLYVGDNAKHMAYELGRQQLVKFGLSEGSTVMVSLMTTLEQQGEYALAANYGSLLTRLMFSPVEEALRSYFGRARENNTRRYAPTSPQEKDEDIAAEHAQGGRGSTDPEEVSLSSNAKFVLTSTLRLYSYMGVLSAGFGPLAAPFALRFLVRSNGFSNAEGVLSAYAYYIPIMAWNGVLEALVEATAPVSVLRWQITIMGGLVVLLTLTTHIFVTLFQWGGAGIVWAQVLTMSLRIIWAFGYMNTHLSGSGSNVWVRDSFPSVYVLSAAVASIACAYKFVPVVETWRQLIILSAFALVPASSMAFAEVGVIKELWGSMKREKVQ